jgi:hypothetical protein
MGYVWILSLSLSINDYVVLSERDIQLDYSLPDFNNLEVQCCLKYLSMVCVRERTIPTERPPLVGAVIANFCG